METFYFTFGVGHAFGDKFQQIVAENMEQARETMFNTFGNAWSFGYSEQEFKHSMSNGYFLNLTPLEPIYSKEAI